jgi:hypothetical protein
MSKLDLSTEKLRILPDNIPNFVELGIYRDVPFDYEPKVSPQELTVLQDLIYDNKKFYEAIKFGNKLLRQYPEEGIVQELLAIAYFKGRKQIHNYRIKCISYVKKALSNRVFNNVLLKRLVLELGKGGCYYQIKQLWDFLKENHNLMAKAPYPINMDYYEAKAVIASKRIDQGIAKDSPKHKLFSKSQKEKIIAYLNS